MKVVNWSVTDYKIANSEVHFDFVNIGLFSYLNTLWNSLKKKFYIVLGVIGFLILVYLLIKCRCFVWCSCCKNLRHRHEIVRTYDTDRVGSRVTRIGSGNRKLLARDIELADIRDRYNIVD